MPYKFKRILAVWFALQIALPFTAPLQTFDLRDLLGKSHTHHRMGDSPESYAMPLTSEAETWAGSGAFVSPLEASTLQASAALAIELSIVRHESLMGPFTSPFRLSPSPKVQQTVLRL